MRIYELGKELNIDSKAIIGFLDGKGYKGLTSASSVPESMMTELKGHFSPAAQNAKKNDVPKAAPLPDYIVKKVEAEAKAQEEKEKQAVQNAPKTPEQEKAAPLQKKKKIIAVFNPQHAQSDKGKAIARKQGDRLSARDGARKPAPSQRIPARDRIPDDEKKAIKRPLPSQIRPARERIPDDERLEMEKAKQLAREQEEARAKAEKELAEAKAAAEMAAAKKKPEPEAPVEVKPVEPPKQEPTETAEKAVSAAPSEAAPEKQQPVQAAVKEVVKEKTEKSPAAAPQEKPKESEAVKSLREKIVKGTVSVSDLKVTKKSPQTGAGPRKDGDRQQD